jgi:hypothetical protein
VSSRARHGPASYLRGTAYRRGVVGSSRGWFWFWVVLAAFNWLRRNAGRAEETVLRFKVEPGERYVITHDTPPSRGRRRDRASGG